MPILLNYLNHFQKLKIQLHNAMKLSCHWDSSGKSSHEILPQGEVHITEKGYIFEKAGIAFSHIKGQTLPPSATERRLELAGSTYQAYGVSAIFHPHNPFVPTAHFNVRYFYAEKMDKTPIWWFGGGFDLTPYYGFESDCIYWHKTAKNACVPFGDWVYPRYKAWCDEYFYLKHRHEPRGIGGIFFDDLNTWNIKTCFSFIERVSQAFIDAYLPIIERRQSHPYHSEHQAFQRYRRGRYVEFNLLYDRGTLFGLQSGGRTESILMSLPPTLEFRYDWQPKPGSLEAKLYTHFLPVRDWVNT